MKTLTWLVPLILYLSAAAHPCPAAGAGLYELGIRVGTNEGTDKKTNLKRFDFIAKFNLPWNWQLGTKANLDTRLMTSLGLLDGEGDESFIGTLGPGICLTDSKRRFSLEMTAGIALIPDYELGEEDFGGQVQFIGDVGINLRIFDRLVLGYRIQHFSDAALFGTDNRGVDMHMLELSYRFP